MRSNCGFAIVAAGLLTMAVSGLNAAIASQQRPPFPGLSKPIHDVVATRVPHPFDRGFAVNVMCSGMHMRGDARLLRNLKRLEVRHGGETDSLTSGVAGYVRYDIKNQAGTVIATGATDVKHCPAKAPGKARICDWSSVGVDVPQDIVDAAYTLEVAPVCTDQPFQPFGANWDAVAKTGLSLFKPGR